MSHALLNSVQDLGIVPRGPGGDPVAFNLQHEPITTREAIDLVDDLDRCTLLWTPVSLPSGRPAVVRTVFLVFDDEASRGPVPEGHVPQLYASELCTADPQRRFVKRLWKYGYSVEAKTGHPEAVAEFQSGRARVDL